MVLAALSLLADGGAFPFDAGADFAPLAAAGGGLEVTAAGGGLAAAFPKGAIAFGGGLAAGLPTALALW